GGELQAGVPVRVGDAEAPGGEVALVEILGLVVDRLAAPVGAAHARAVPQVDRITAAQEDALVALAAVPAVLPHLGGRAVPHDQADRPALGGDEVLDVAVVAGERLARVGRVADDLAADFIGAGRFEHDGRLGRGAGALRAGDAAGRQAGERQQP